MSSPCHIELILSEKEEPVKKEVCGCILFVPDYSIPSKGLMFCAILVNGFFFRLTPRSQPGRLREGGHLL
jgi:hypothetical protein